MTITKTSNRNIEYKCRVYVPKAIPAYSYKNIVEYYRPYSGENEISRDDNGSVVEFNIHGENKPMLEGAYMPDLFRRFARQLINKENVDDLFTIFEQSISHINYITERIELAKVFLSFYGEYDSYTAVFEILKDQKGYGYMGGTGCGTKIHHLTFDKIVGVKEGLPKKVERLAEIWLAGMLGIISKIVADKKYLRDAIKEEDLFVTLNAHPDCQNTVRYVEAQGFPIEGVSVENITCKKCLKITLDK